MGQVNDRARSNVYLVWRLARVYKRGRDVCRGAEAEAEVEAEAAKRVAIDAWRA